MIAIPYSGVRDEVSRSEFYETSLPRVIDGLDVVEALSPVSKKTGLRENFLTILRKVVADPRKQVLLQQALQELPADNSQSKLSDSEKLDFLTMRLSSGSPAEDDLIRQRLESVLDVLPKSAAESVEQKIEKSVAKPVEQITDEV